MSALITNAESLKALTIVRSLGQKGILVTTGSAETNPLASSSRYTSHHITYPSPVKDPNGFNHTIHQFLIKYQHDVLLPIHSEDTMVLGRYANCLSNVTHFPFPRFEDMILINDKGYLAVVAEELGIPIPRTLVPDRPDQVSQVAKKITFPVVIKLRNRTSSLGQSYASSMDELIKVYMKTIKAFALKPGEYPIIQEYIAGTGYGVSLLFNHGDLRARFTHKRIREYPISGGPSTCRVSTRHQIMEDYAVRLMTHFSWHGIAMVEFKLSRDGIPYLLEVNPRFWGSVNQAVQSGVDFPYLLYQMAVDGDVRPVYSYREGVVTRNVMLDAISFIQGIIEKPPYQSRNPLIQYPFYDDIISLKDPLPFIHAMKEGVSNIRRIRSKNNRIDDHRFS